MAGTLKLSLSGGGLDELTISRIQSLIPNQIGQTTVPRRSINGIAQANFRASKPLGFAVDALMTQAEFALFEEYLYEQELDSNRGNLLLSNEYTPVNDRWSQLYERVQIGSAQTTHGTIDQYFVRYPVLLIVPSDYWEVAGTNNRGQWKLVKFETEELIKPTS